MSPEHVRNNYKQIKSLGWTEPPKATTNASQHKQLSQLRTIADRAEEAINNTWLVLAGMRWATQFSNSNSVFLTAPLFATTINEEQEAASALPPLPEIQVDKPSGPPPDQFDGTVATGPVSAH